jgi:hypothetical protein
MVMGMTRVPGQAFPGLKLRLRDKEELHRKRRQRASDRTWRRIRMLCLLDEGETLTAVGEAVGSHPREVRRVGWRYLKGGLEAALSDESRPRPDKLLDKKTESAVIALACTDPPDGYERWSVRLLAEHVVKRGIVVTVGRETIRRVLEAHDLKPWREKNVVRSTARRRVR